MSTSHQIQWNYRGEYNPFGTWMANTTDFLGFEQSSIDRFYSFDIGKSYTNLPLVFVPKSNDRYCTIDPSTFGKLVQIQDLELYSNQLIGTIPSALGNLLQLTYLNMYNNQLTGTIPSTLGNLRQLKELYLNYNILSGTIPSELSTLAQLIVLGMSYNKLNGVIPSRLGILVQLASLNLCSNQLSGTIPSTLGYLTRLNKLHLYNNTNLRGTVPASLCFKSEISIQIDCGANVECSCCTEGVTGARCQ